VSVNIHLFFRKREFIHALAGEDFPVSLPLPTHSFIPIKVKVLYIVRNGKYFICYVAKVRARLPKNV